MTDVNSTMTGTFAPSHDLVSIAVGGVQIARRVDRSTLMGNIYILQRSQRPFLPSIAKRGKRASGDVSKRRASHSVSFR